MYLGSSASRWRTPQCTGDIPPGRIGHTLCTNTREDKIFLYGGVNDNNEGTSNYLDDLHVFDFNLKEWTQIEMSGETQCPRAFHTAVYYGTEIYVFGGCNGRGRFNRLFSISESGLCEAISSGDTTPPSTRYCHSAVIFQTKMYIFAGKCGGRNSNKRLDDLLAFDFERKTWCKCSQGGQRPESRSAHAALTCGRSMIMFGGRNKDGMCCEDIYMYSYDSGMWRKVEPLSNRTLFGRARNSVVAHNGRVVVFGGWNGRKKLNDLFTYHVDSNVLETFHELDDRCPSRRECHVAVMCNNTMVVFGGRFRGFFMSDTVELDLGFKSLKDACREWILRSDYKETDPNSQLQKLPLRIRQFIGNWRSFTYKSQKDPQTPQESNAQDALSSDNNSQAE